MENKKIKPKFKQREKSNSSYFIALLICAMLVGGITYFMYLHTQSLLRDRLDERLTAIVSTAAEFFDPEEIRYIKNAGMNSVDSEVYKRNVLMLQAVRDANMDIEYVYIMAETDDKYAPIFVIDADAMSIVPTIDYNEDGVIDELDVTEPGEVYDASEAPALQGPAFIETTVDPEITVDEWGNYLSAYGPIIDENGNTVGSLTIDVEVTDYMRIVSATFMPFTLFIIVLLLILLFLTISIVRIWKSRVDLLKDLDQQKDELLGIVSHQLATPVSSIKWYLEMMLDGDIGELSNEQKEHVKSLQFSAANLADLVSMILDVSRIQLGRMKADRTDIELSKLFEEEVKGMEPRAKEQGVKLVKDIQKDMPVAMLDMRLMRMTMENLLSNAIKYTPKGGTVTLKAAIHNGKLEYLVSDTGCGIPACEHDKIFGKLFRASNVGKIDGNGFGLYVAKGAVEAQGGKISFKSKEGRGTVFSIVLPVKEPKN